MCLEANYFLKQHQRIAALIFTSQSKYKTCQIDTADVLNMQRGIKVNAVFCSLSSFSQKILIKEV